MVESFEISQIYQDKMRILSRRDESNKVREYLLRQDGLYGVGKSESLSVKTEGLRNHRMVKVVAYDQVVVCGLV